MLIFLIFRFAVPKKKNAPEAFPEYLEIANKPVSVSHVGQLLSEGGRGFREFFCSFDLFFRYSLVNYPDTFSDKKC